MKSLEQFIMEWGGEKMRKPSMKDQINALRDALKKNEDLELALEYDYVITDIIYNGNELEITVSSDDVEPMITTVKEFLEAEDGAVLKCKKISWIEKYDEFYLEDTFVQDDKLYLQIEQK